MLKHTLTAIAFLAASALTAAAQDIGFTQIDLDTPTRPLHIALWYPTQGSGQTEAPGENGVFYGVQAITDATPGAGPSPLVVLSHGYGGSWRNLSWVAEALADQGYIVAAPDHPGTTSFNRDPAMAAALWQRPQDLSHVIDALIADPSLAGRVDPNRIAAVGHSLGGWTVAALGGARVDVARTTSDCATQADLRACTLLEELGVTQANAPQIEADLSDPRIRAIVSLDLGLARSFTPESLQSYPIPALVIAAGTDIAGLPAMLESGSLIANLPAPTTTYIEIPDAMHFTFMQLCKPNAVAILTEEEPGEEFVCIDPGPRERAAIHKQTTDSILNFLAQTIPAN